MYSVVQHRWCEDRVAEPKKVQAETSLSTRFGLREAARGEERSVTMLDKLSSIAYRLHKTHDDSL